MQLQPVEISRAVAGRLHVAAGLRQRREHERGLRERADAVGQSHDARRKALDHRLVADALAVVKAPAADVWVVEAGTQGPFAEASSIPATTRDAVARMPGVAEAGAITYQTIEASHAGGTLRLYVIGFEPGRPGGPQRITEGRGLGRSHFELLADRKTGLVPGETIRLVMVLSP